MNLKNVSLSGLAGAIVNYLLGWLFYGMLFKDNFPQPEESSESLLLIFLGCLTFGLFVAYIFNHWAQIKTLATGAKAGAIIGFFLGLYWNFFNMAMDPSITVQMFLLDMALTIVMSAITGAVIGLVLGKLNK